MASDSASTVLPNELLFQIFEPLDDGIALDHDDNKWNDKKNDMNKVWGSENDELFDKISKAHPQLEAVADKIRSKRLRVSTLEKMLWGLILLANNPAIGPNVRTFQCNVDLYLPVDPDAPGRDERIDGIKALVTHLWKTDKFEKLEDWEFYPKLGEMLRLAVQNDVKYWEPEFLGNLAQTLFFGILLKMPNLEELVLHITPSPSTTVQPRYQRLHSHLHEFGKQISGRLNRLILVPLMVFVKEQGQNEVKTKRAAYWTHLHVLPLIQIPSVRKVDMWGCVGRWQYHANMLSMFGYPREEAYLKHYIAHIEEFRFRDLRNSGLWGLERHFLKYVNHVKSLELSSSRTYHKEYQLMNSVGAIIPNLEGADEMNLHKIHESPKIASLNKLAVCGPYVSKVDLEAHFGSNMNELRLENLPELKGVTSLALPSFALFGNNPDKIREPVHLPPQLTDLEIIEDGHEDHRLHGGHSFKLYDAIMAFAGNAGKYKPALQRVTFSFHIWENSESASKVKWSEEEIAMAKECFKKHNIEFSFQGNKRIVDSGMKEWFIW